MNWYWEVIKIFPLRRLKSEFIANLHYINRLDRNILIFIIYGLLYDTVMNIYKPFAVKYLERIGGESIHVTLYNSLPGMIAALSLFPLSLLIARVKKKKGITSIFILLSRAVLFSVAFVPMANKSLQPILFVCLISLMNFPEAISQTSMQSFIGDIFDGRVRATALSLRNKFGNFFILIVTLLSGLIISYVPSNNQQVIWCYQVFFVAAFLIGLAEVFVFRRLKEKEGVPASVENAGGAGAFKEPVLGTIKEVFKNKVFVKYAAASLVYYFSWHAGWAVSSLFIVANRGATEIWLAVFAVLSGLASFLSASFWNKLISRQGNETALVLAGLVMALNMFLIVFSPNLYFLLFQSMINGIGAIGLNITLLNGLLQSTPDKNRIIYIGVYNTLVNISLGVWPLVIQLILNAKGIVVAISIVGIMRIFASIIIAAVYKVNLNLKGIRQRGRR